MERLRLHFPLAWPFGRPRTALPKRAAFVGTNVSGQLEALASELGRLRAKDVRVTTNIPLTSGGAMKSTSEPTDRGVAVSFTIMNGKYPRPYVLACDRWQRVADNLRAIVLHVEALRGQERWGVSTIEEAFRGHLALPAHASAPAKPWREVLGNCTTVEAARRVAKHLRAAHHPDVKGDPETYHAIQTALEAAELELGKPGEELGHG